MKKLLYISITTALAVVSGVLLYVNLHAPKPPPKSAKITLQSLEEWMARYAYMDEFLGKIVVPEWSMVSSNSVDGDGKRWTITWSDKGITNLCLTTNYVFTIQVGDKFFTRADLLK